MKKRLVAPKPKYSTLYNCIYTKDKHNFISGCGYRVPVTRLWRYCPFCGKLISRLWNSLLEDDKEG